MGACCCCASGSEAAELLIDPLLASDAQLHPAADYDRDDSRASGASDESSASELFNGILQSALPVVKFSIGKKLLELNRRGGVPLGAARGP